MDVSDVVVGVVFVSLAAWFWPHCARPALKYRHAGPTLTRLMFTVTIYTLVACGLYLAIAFAGPVPRLVGLLAFAPYVLLVQLPYLPDEYKALVRFTGNR